jgi:hypothetical protein
MPPQRVENTFSSLDVVFYWIHVIDVHLLWGSTPIGLVTQHIEHVIVLHKTCAMKVQYSLERGVKIHLV